MIHSLKVEDHEDTYGKKLSGGTMRKVVFLHQSSIILHTLVVVNYGMRFLWHIIKHIFFILYYIIVELCHEYAR